MNNKSFFIVSFLLLFSLSLTSLFSQTRKRPVAKSPQFKSSEDLRELIESNCKKTTKEIESLRKCLICSLGSKKENSIEFLNCGHMVHVGCARKMCNKFGTDFFFFNCLNCIDCLTFRKKLN